MKHYDRIAEGIESLEIMPERCRLLESEPELEQGIRQLLVDSYSAFYMAGDSKVTVLRVLYGASDIAPGCGNRIDPGNPMATKNQIAHAN